MSQCIQEVRKNVSTTIKRLFTEISNLNIGVVCHGDYCDGDNAVKTIDLTNDVDKLVNFVNTSKNTFGGDYPECYELVLRKVQSFNWRSDGLKALVMIGDATPHEANDNPGKIDWRVECDELKNMGVNIYSVQALKSGNGAAYMFYKQMALRTDGYHIFLDQFSYIKDILLAICSKLMSNEQLEKYEQEVKDRNTGMTLSMRKFFDTLLNRKNDDVEEEADEEADDDDTVIAKKTKRVRKTKAVGELSEKLAACPPAKYQILEVDSDTSIKDYVVKRELVFKTGMGFYEFTKPETITSSKLIVLMKKDTGELYEGKEARTIAKLSEESKRYKPSDIEEYRVFIQSTSANRKLVKDTGFLYLDSEFGRT